MTFTPASYPEGNQAGLDTEPGFSIAAWQQRPESLGWVNVKVQILLKNQSFNQIIFQHQKIRELQLKV